MGIRTSRAGAFAAVLLIAAVSATAGWFAGTHRSASGTAPPALSAGTPLARGGDLPAGVSPLPSAPVLEPAAVTGDQAKSFAVLECRARQFNGTLALAVTFSQPVSRQADLREWIEVRDAGRVDTDDDVNPKPAEKRASVSPFSNAIADAVLQASRPVPGQWTVGDDARVVYFPYAQASRRYLIQFDAALASDRGAATLAKPSYCDLPTDVMPAAFYFASKGVVLPAGQNGGLPVATVNVSEVDVQFLRVDPDRAPAFFSTMLGVAAPSASQDDASGDEASGDESDDYKDESYHSDTSLKGLVGLYDLDRLRTLTTSVFQGRFMTDPTADRRNITYLPVEQIEALKAPGIYVAVMTQPGRFQYESQVTYFYVSDIGLHARRQASGLDVFTVSLTSGQPLTDTRVELIDGAGRVLARAAADAAGHARFDGQYDTARVLRAVRKSEMTLLALGEPALDLSEFDVGGLPGSEHKLFVYAGRNLYRPGETFTVSVLARDPDGQAGASVPLTATVKRADGRTVSTALWQPTPPAPGYSQRQIELPADAQTGAWRLELRIDPAQRRPDAVWTFNVEEFLPERMKLTLEAPNAPEDASGAFEVAVQGDYLYGAPAAGNRLLATLQVRRDRQPLAQQWPGFVFGDVADDDKKSFQTLEEATLDDSGAAQIDVDPQFDGVHSPMRVRLSASLLESGGRPVVRSLERTVWPADVLVGVRPAFEGDVTRQGAPAEFELIRVDRQGNFQPATGLTLKLFKETRQYYWRFDDQRGWNSGYAESETLLETRKIDLTARASLSLPVDWGRYRVEIADPQTGETLRYRFYAGWDAQDAETLGNRPDRVQMQLEGTPARPGDTIRLKMTPPHDGHALVTVEGGSLLWSKWVPAQAAGTSVEIPLDPSWRRQDLYVTATVFRPGSRGDQITPARAVGMAYIPMDNTDRKLQVEVQAPERILPETRVRAKVTVQGAKPGAPAFVTVSAVDVGILNINAYATPDPFGFFFGKHRYGSELLDMYGKLIEKMPGVAGRLRWGGDADRRGDSRSLPKKVKLVDLFSGVVVLDERGQADIDLNVPDFNGTLRLMAVAFDATRYGSAEREMQVAAPIVAELSTPRFITPGDQAAIALDVTNMSGQAREVHIDLQANTPLRLSEGRRTLMLAAGQRSILRFTATGDANYGPGLIRLGIDAPAVQAPGQPALAAYRSVRESILTVQPPYGPTRRTHQVRILPGQTFAVPDEWLAGLIPVTSTMSVSLSSRLPFDLPRLVRDLLEYPYGCTEQTISAAMPWLVLDQQAVQQYKIKLEGNFSSLRQTKVDQAIARLAGMRSGNGAYALWGGGGERDVWITAYAVAFLQQAKTQGFTINERDLAAPTQWLLTTLQRSHTGFGTWSADLRRQVEQGSVAASGADILRNDHRRFAGLAAAAYSLSLDGRAPLSSVRTLFDRFSERSRSPLPLIHLAVAFKQMGDAPRAQRAVQAALTRDYGIARRESGTADTWLGDYGSALRDYALAYALLVEHDLGADRRESLLSQLAGLVGSRRYYSTQEQLALLLAARASGADAKPWQVEMQQASGLTTLQGADTASATLATVGGGRQLTNSGAVPVFASFDVQGTAVAAPIPDRRVVDIQRTWYRPDGRAWDGAVLRTGDMIVVRLRAKSRTAMPDALIVDQVPAGMEVENLNLSQGPQTDQWTLGGTSVASAMQDSRIRHTEFRDDRFVAAVELGQGEVDVFYMLRVVTPGRFSVPAATVEAMYRPELRGVGDTWRPIDIRDRQIGTP